MNCSKKRFHFILIPKCGVMMNMSISLSVLMWDSHPFCQQMYLGIILPYNGFMWMLYLTVALYCMPIHDKTGYRMNLSRGSHWPTWLRIAVLNVHKGYYLSRSFAENNRFKTSSFSNWKLKSECVLIWKQVLLEKFFQTHRSKTKVKDCSLEKGYFTWWSLFDHISPFFALCEPRNVL